MKKSYFVFIDGNHEYTITSKEKNNGDIKYSLYYSNNEPWEETVRGTKCLSIIEGDLEMKFKGVKKIKGMLPYHVVSEIRILLNFITRENDDNFEIIENKVICKF